MTESSSQHAQRDKDPRFWEAGSFRIRVIQGDSESWATPSQPFALIGAADCCDVKLTGSTNIPPVAYFVCCLRNRIEAWPTAAIAFPRWGIVSPEMELLVGHIRITIQMDDFAEAGLADNDVNAEVIRTKLISKNQALDKKLKRSITIIGDRHPSTLRLRGRGLNRCHFAAVAQDSNLWIVNVSGKRLALRDRVQVLQQPGDSAHMGNVTIELSPRRANDGFESNTVTKKQSPPGSLGGDRQIRNPVTSDHDEELSAVLTDRLINRSQSLKRKILFATVMVAVLLLTAYLWTNLLQKIYRDWF